MPSETGEDQTKYADMMRRIAELERLGDAMAEDLVSIAGVGPVCGLCFCHVNSDDHKHNCDLNDADAWRAFRERPIGEAQTKYAEEADVIRAALEGKP